MRKTIHLVTLLSLCGFGCEQFQEAAFNRPYGANGYKILVVPFRETSKRSGSWYAESERGKRLVIHLKSWAELNADDPLFTADLVEKDIVTQIRNNDDWYFEGDVPAQAWRQLAGATGVRFAVVGDIQSFRLRNRMVIGLYHPEMSVEIRVFDVPKGKKVYTKVLRITDSGGRASPRMDIAATGPGDSSAVEEVLLQRAGERIGQELYGYYR
jgi:hypothetical protein